MRQVSSSIYNILFQKGNYHAFILKFVTTPQNIKPLVGSQADRCMFAFSYRLHNYFISFKVCFNLMRLNIIKIFKFLDYCTDTCSVFKKTDYQFSSTLVYSKLLIRKTSALNLICFVLERAQICREQYHRVCVAVPLNSFNISTVRRAASSK